jgi:hypothetical protein
MGKINIKFMGRNIRAFGHKTHITQGARISHCREAIARHLIQLTARRLINEVKKPWETIT